MNQHLKRILVLTVGIVCIVLGFAGLALPFLQGFLFLAIGFILISMVSPAVRTWMEHHTRKFPKVHAMVEKIEKKITDIIGLP